MSWEGLILVAGCCVRRSVATPGGVVLSSPMWCPAVMVGVAFPYVVVRLWVCVLMPLLGRLWIALVTVGLPKLLCGLLRVMRLRWYCWKGVCGLSVFLLGLVYGLLHIVCLGWCLERVRVLGVILVGLMYRLLCVDWCWRLDVLAILAVMFQSRSWYLPY